VHRIIVIPFAAPDEAMLFEGFDDFSWDLVGGTAAAFAPAPVGGVFGVDVDGGAEGVDAEAPGPGDVAPVEGAADGNQVFPKLGITFQFAFYGKEMGGDSVDGGDPDLLPEPVDGGQMSPDLGGGVAVHFFEEGFVSDAAGVVVLFLGHLEARGVVGIVSIAEHILQIRMVEQLVEGFASTVVIAHFCAIFPVECVTAARFEPIGIGTNQSFAIGSIKARSHHTENHKSFSHGKHFSPFISIIGLLIIPIAMQRGSAASFYPFPVEDLVDLISFPAVESTIGGIAAGSEGPDRPAGAEAVAFPGKNGVPFVPELIAAHAAVILAGYGCHR